MRNGNHQSICTAVFAALLLLQAGRLHAATPQGEFVFSGKGALLLSFDGTGAFSGVGAVPRFGMVSVTGSVAGAGAYEFHDRISGTLVDSGAAVFTSTSRGFRLVLGATRGLSFIGFPRLATSPVPAGLFAAPVPPVEVLYQVVPSGDRLVVTLQGDQDFSLDLHQALGGQFIFDQRGRGFGVVYENGDPNGARRWATMKFSAKGALALRVYTDLFFGKSHALRLAAVSSGGKFDGVYSVIATPDGCTAQTLKLTVKDNVVSGSDGATGSLTGIVDFTGHITFVTQRFTVTDSLCAQSGAHVGAVTFNGDLSKAAFPRVAEGTFSGTGLSGTFVLNQPTGVTGATSPSTTPRAEIWSGTLSGTHVSNICNGGQWEETYTVRLTFPSDVISALRGKNTILSGSGTMSGTEVVISQPPAQLDCTYLDSTLAETALTILFAGNVSPNGSVIDLNSSSVLIPSTVHFTNGDPDQGENRSALRLHVKHFNATQLKGEWPFGTFILKKQ